MSNVIPTLVELGYACNDESQAKLEQLSQKSTRDLITDFILPNVVMVGGQDTRGWRLSGSFMWLMARHARELIAGDRELGNMLFELAMQRIQRHPALKAIDYVGILPEGYKKYSAADDQPGLWGDEEWEFIKLRLLDGLKLSTPSYREHCKALLLEIWKEVLPMCGEGSGWFGIGTKVSGKELLNWAFCTAVAGYVPLDEVIASVLKDRKWHWYKKFLNKCVREYGVSWDSLFQHIDLDKEEYYCGFFRHVLKTGGLYGKKTKERIKEEILCSEEE